jgi:PPOX class probable F420-dependent enzyme
MLDLNKERHAHIDARLRNDMMIWLSSVRPDGRAHLVPVWFLWTGEVFYVFSKPDQKIRNLQQNTSVVLGLDDTKGGEEPIMIEGEATLLPPGEVDATMSAYAAKYRPRFEQYNWTPETMAKDYTEAILIRPSKLYGG